MFGALRLECNQHASEHHEELAGIQVEVNISKDHRRCLWILKLGATENITLLVDGMITIILTKDETVAFS